MDVELNSDDDVDVNFYHDDDDDDDLIPAVDLSTPQRPTSSSMPELQPKEKSTQIFPGDGDAQPMVLDFQAAAAATDDDVVVDVVVAVAPTPAAAAAAAAAATPTPAAAAAAPTPTPEPRNIKVRITDFYESWCVQDAIIILPSTNIAFTLKNEDMFTVTSINSTDIKVYWVLKWIDIEQRITTLVSRRKDASLPDCGHVTYYDEEDFY